MKKEMYFYLFYFFKFFFLKTTLDHKLDRKQSYVACTLYSSAHAL